MAFDAFYLSAVLTEIRQLGEARVDKIHQPSRDTVILHLKGRETRAKLLIAANPAAPRLHLTTANPENPPEPPIYVHIEIPNNIYEGYLENVVDDTICIKINAKGRFKRVNIKYEEISLIRLAVKI